MKSIDDRLAAAERKATAAKAALQQARAAKARAEARKLAPLLKSERAEDTRRKILVGAAVMSAVSRGEMPQERLQALLDTFLQRPDDRALFNLLPIAESLAARIDARKIEEGIPF